MSSDVAAAIRALDASVAGFITATQKMAVAIKGVLDLEAHIAPPLPAPHQLSLLPTVLSCIAAEADAMLQQRRGRIQDAFQKALPSAQQAGSQAPLPGVLDASAMLLVRMTASLAADLSGSISVALNRRQGNQRTSSSSMTRPSSLSFQPPAALQRSDSSTFKATDSKSTSSGFSAVTRKSPNVTSGQPPTPQGLAASTTSTAAAPMRSLRQSPLAPSESRQASTTGQLPTFAGAASHLPPARTPSPLTPWRGQLPPSPRAAPVSIMLPSSAVPPTNVEGEDVPAVG